jgi:hypothetical protein
MIQKRMLNVKSADYQLGALWGEGWLGRGWGGRDDRGADRMGLKQIGCVGGGGMQGGAKKQGLKCNEEVVLGGRGARVDDVLVFLIDL